ncbi:MAG: MATE family efflux transporter, partial [Cellulosilyticaceae bacterium]
FFMELAAGSIHLVTNRILGSYGGDLAIGAMTTITSIGLLFLMPVYGISQGMQTIVAYNYGAREIRRTKRTLYLAMSAATGVLVVGWILIRCMPEFFVGIFTQDVYLTALAINGIGMHLLALPAIGISILGAVYFQTIGDSKRAVFLSLLRQVIVLIPLILILPRGFGVDGVWLAQPLADIITLVIVGGMLLRYLKNYH